MCKFHHNKLNILELNNFCITNNIPLEFNSEEDIFDFKNRVMKHLYPKKHHEKLYILFELLQIGKYAFVEEEIVVIENEKKTKLHF